MKSIRPAGGRGAALTCLRFMRHHEYHAARRVLPLALTPTQLKLLVTRARPLPPACGGHATAPGRPSSSAAPEAFADALRLVQMLAPIRRDARVKDMVMAALDHVDGINLQIAEVRHCCGRGLRAGAEGFGDVQALGVQPDSARLGGGELDERANLAARHQGRNIRRCRRRAAQQLRPFQKPAKKARTAARPKLGCWWPPSAVCGHQMTGWPESQPW